MSGPQISSHQKDNPSCKIQTSEALATPTDPSATFDQSEQLCRQKLPCDIDYLKIKVSIPKERGAPKTRKLETTRMLRHTSINGRLPNEARALLNSHDLLIDVIAGSPSENNTAPANRAIVEVRTRYQERCAVGLHPLIKLKARETQPADDQSKARTESWHQLSSEKRSYYSAPSPWDWHKPGGGIGVLLFGMIPRNNAIVSLQAISCGHRDKGESIRQLSAAVRILPADAWAISLRGQLVKFSTDRKRETTVLKDSTGKRKSEVSVTQSVDWAHHKETHTRGTKNGSAFVSGSKVTLDEKFDFERNVSGQKPGDQWAEYGDGFSRTTPDGKLLPIDLVITRNGKKFEGLKTIKELIEIAEKFENSIKDILSILSAVPKIGIWYSCSATLLSGTLQLRLENKMLDEVVAERYLPVESRGHIDFNLTLVKLSLSINAGFTVEWKLSTAIRAIASASISFTLAAKINQELNSGAEGSLQIKPIVDIQFAGEVEVTLAGWNLVHGKVWVSINIHASATLKWGGKKPVELKTKPVTLDPIYLQYFVKSPFYKKEPRKQKLVDGRVLVRL